jgi:antitoxin component of RelBE/YafQ-DinJ toxin-antitoxin module
MRTVLQVPMTSTLKNNAVSAAKDMGFSSLQEVVRVLLNKLATRDLSLSIEEKIIPLSAKNEKRYLKMDKDFKKNNKVHSVKDVSELMKQLNAD